MMRRRMGSCELRYHAVRPRNPRSTSLAEGPPTGIQMRQPLAKCSCRTSSSPGWLCPDDSPSRYDAHHLDHVDVDCPHWIERLPFDGLEVPHWTNGTVE
jgi:hypothetical protein